MLESVMGLLGEVGATVLTGGLSGILGTAVSFGINLLQKRQDHRQEMDLRRLDVEHARVEAEGAERTATIEADAARDAAEGAALRASYDEAMRRWSRPGDGWALKLVDVVRGLTRPALTVMFIALTGAIYFTLEEGRGEMRGQIVDAVLYCATTCTVWWFGGRQIDKRAAAR